MSNIFETTNVDLGTYLVFSGIDLIKCKVKDLDHKIIIMSFNDETCSCLNLERTFLSSDYKKFRDINKWLLKKIHQELKSIK